MSRHSTTHRRGAATVLAVMIGMVVGSCGGDDSAATDDGGRLQLVANFYPVAEAMRRVGGDLVEVTNLTPPGAEPHDLELTTDEVDAIQDADLVAYLGADFQPGVAAAAGDRSGPSLDITDAVTLEEGDAGDGADEHGSLDPHFWLDPTLMVSAVEAIEAELAAVAPDDAETFASNAAAYVAELQALDAEMAAGLGRCERTQIVTAHAAFHYLAERYGLEQLAVTGLSPESEPDPARFDELVDLIERDGVTTVFYETLVSPDIAETLAREAGVTTAVLNPLEGLSAEQIDDGADYVSVQRENLAALQAALGCST